MLHAKDCRLMSGEFDRADPERCGTCERETINAGAHRHPCIQCGKPNPGWFLGAVCGSCCKANHRAVAG